MHLHERTQKSNTNKLNRFLISVVGISLDLKLLDHWNGTADVWKHFCFLLPSNAFSIFILKITNGRQCAIHFKLEQIHFQPYFSCGLFYLCKQNKWGRFVSFSIIYSTEYAYFCICHWLVGALQMIPIGMYWTHPILCACVMMMMPLEVPISFSSTNNTTSSSSSNDTIACIIETYVCVSAHFFPVHFRWREGNGNRKRRGEKAWAFNGNAMHQMHALHTAHIWTHASS